MEIRFLSIFDVNMASIMDGNKLISGFSLFPRLNTRKFRFQLFYLAL